MQKKLAIIGSGYIAVEFAFIFASLGSKVSLICRKGLLRGFDANLVSLIKDRFSSKGINIYLNEEAKKVLSEAGCKVDMNSDNVKMDRSWVKEMISKAPSEFEIFPRNINRSVKIGGRNMAFVNVSSPPNVMDLDRGRRVGDFESFKDLIKLTQYFKIF